MGDKHTVAHLDSDWTGTQEPQHRITDIFTPLTIHLLHAAAKRQVQHPFRFGDRKVGELGQFVITEQKVDLIWELSQQSSDVLQHQMRHIRIGAWIAWSTMTNFLHDQMSPRILRQIGVLQNAQEIQTMTVQVGSYQNLIGSFGGKPNEMAFSFRFAQVDIPSRAKGRNNLIDGFGIGCHGDTKE